MNDNRNYFICDIDGTLADVEHRRHWVRSYPKNWDAFFAAAKRDEVRPHVRTVVQSLVASGFKCILVSGRPERTRTDTEEWLREHEIPYEVLLMREDGDMRPDYTVKSGILTSVVAQYGEDPMFVIDDRTSVIKMWRERGLPVFDVGDGDFK